MKNYQRHRGNFAVALEELANAKPKQHFATPAEAMDERMKKGVDSDIFKEGAWYNASFNEVNGRILGTRREFNPLNDYAKKAVESMRTGEFYLSDDILINNRPASKVLTEIAEQDSKKPVHKRRVIDLGQTITHDVPTDCFGDDETIVFLAEGKERAKKYGLFLKNKAGILQSKVYMQDIIKKDKSRGFWLYRLDDYNVSDFSCSDWGLSGDGGSLFGVYEGAEGTQKISKGVEGPSLSELLKYSRPFVPEAVKKDFEKGLREKFEKQ